MKLSLRRLLLSFLAVLPIASISFAAQKALKTGELRDIDEEMERSGAPSIM